MGSAEQDGTPTIGVVGMKRRMAYSLGMAIIVLSWAGRPAAAQEVNETEGDRMPTARSFYDHQVKTIDGRTVSLSEYKGQVCLVVNTASQ